MEQRLEISGRDDSLAMNRGQPKPEVCSRNVRITIAIELLAEDTVNEV